MWLRNVRQPRLQRQRRHSVCNISGRGIIQDSATDIGLTVRIVRQFQAPLDKTSGTSATIYLYSTTGGVLAVELF